MNIDTDTEDHLHHPARQTELSSVYVTRGSALTGVQFSLTRSTYTDSITTYRGPPKAFRSRESTNTRVTTEIEDPPPKNIQDLTAYLKEPLAKPNESSVKQKILFAAALIFPWVTGFGIGISVGKKLSSNIASNFTNNNNNVITGEGTEAPTCSPLAYESNCLIGFDEAFGSCQFGSRSSFMCVSESQYMACDTANRPVLGSNGGIALFTCPGTSHCICNQFSQQIGDTFDPCNPSNANQCLNF